MRKKKVKQEIRKANTKKKDKKPLESFKAFQESHLEEK